VRRLRLRGQRGHVPAADAAPGKWRSGPRVLTQRRVNQAASSDTGTGWRVAALSRFHTLIEAIEISSADSSFSS
jgi:hypothetical protein